MIFALVRYNADGSLDASFDGGWQSHYSDWWGAMMYGSISDPAGGRQVGGGGVVATTAAILMLRWCATTPMAPWILRLMAMAKSPRRLVGAMILVNSVIQQADGKLVVAGHSYNGNNYDVALVRYDSGQLITTTNLWLKKLATKVGAGSNDDRWSAQYLYNADRRSGQVFDPANDALNVALERQQHLFACRIPS
jgi:hypothetical protein